MRITPVEIKWIEYYVDGEMSFKEPMIFKRLFAVGDRVVEKSRHYDVTAVTVEGEIQRVELNLVASASLPSGDRIKSSSYH